MFRKSVITLAFVAISSNFAIAAEPVAIDEGRFDWTGLYFGGQAGYGRSDIDIYEGPDPAVTFYVGGTPGDFLQTFTSSSGVYGIVAGYNWQMDNVVFGIEGSYLSSSMSKTIAVGAITSTVEVNSIFTVGPRIGVAEANWLLYAEGGYASADIEINGFSTGGALYNSSADHDGYFFGAGFEWALDQNWIFGFEYNHIALDSEIQSDTVATFGLVDILVDDIRIDTATARLTYKF